MGGLYVNDGVTVAFEVGGLTPGSEHDELIFMNDTLGEQINLRGNLDITLTEFTGSPFLPAPTDTFTIVSSNVDIVGSFENVANGDRLKHHRQVVTNHLAFLDICISF